MTTEPFLPPLKLQEAEWLHKIIFVPFALVVLAFVVDMFAFYKVYVSDIKKIWNTCHDYARHNWQYQYF